MDLTVIHCSRPVGFDNKQLKCKFKNKNKNKKSTSTAPTTKHDLKVLEIDKRAASPSPSPLFPRTKWLYWMTVCAVSDGFLVWFGLVCFGGFFFFWGGGGGGSVLFCVALLSFVLFVCLGFVLFSSSLVCLYVGWLSCSSVDAFVRSFVCAFVHLFVPLFVCLFVSLSVCLSVCLFLCWGGGGGQCVTW